MTRDQWDEWSRMFAGSTVRELRHMRDVPRASVRLGVQAPVAHHRPLRLDLWLDQIRTRRTS